RARPGAQGQPAEARDPPPRPRGAAGARGAAGRPGTGGGRAVAGHGPRDRAHDPGRARRGRLPEHPAVERSLGLMCGAGALAARAGALTDVRILDVIVQTLADLRITLLDQREFLGDDLAAAGCWSARTPTEEERRDVERGLGLARQAAEARIGQTVVLRRGAIAAVEALEGTTEAIRRGTALAGPGAVIVKAVAPDHDYRFDTPVVGSESLRAAAAGRASVVAVEAGRVLVVEREASVRHADLAGIAFVGVEDAG